MISFLLYKNNFKGQWWYGHLFSIFNAQLTKINWESLFFYFSIWTIKNLILWIKSFDENNLEGSTNNIDNDDENL